MITAIHTLIYSDDPEATRAFFRDVLQWPYLEHPNPGSGWLIFKTGPSELGVHPTSWGGEKQCAPHHSVSLMCDDIEGTVADLRSRGAVFSNAITNQGFGHTINLMVPGAGEIMLYQPLHQEAFRL